jgi:hypothetical protein
MRLCRCGIRSGLAWRNCGYIVWGRYARLCRCGVHGGLARCNCGYIAWGRYARLGCYGLWCDASRPLCVLSCLLFQRSQTLPGRCASGVKAQDALQAVALGLRLGQGARNPEPGLGIIRVGAQGRTQPASCAHRIARTERRNSATGQIVCRIHTTSANARTINAAEVAPGS